MMQVRGGEIDLSLSSTSSAVHHQIERRHYSNCAAATAVDESLCHQRIISVEKQAYI